MRTLITGQQGTPALCPANRAFFYFFINLFFIFFRGKWFFFEKKCVPNCLFLSRYTRTLWLHVQLCSEFTVQLYVTCDISVKKCYKQTITWSCGWETQPGPPRRFLFFKKKHNAPLFARKKKSMIQYWCSLVCDKQKHDSPLFVASLKNYLFIYFLPGPLDLRVLITLQVPDTPDVVSPG
jgi:hypothetical protein